MMMMVVMMKRRRRRRLSCPERVVRNEREVPIFLSWACVGVVNRQVSVQEPAGQL